MGIVLRATHLQVGSTVAVKLMRPGPERHVAQGGRARVVGTVDAVTEAHQSLTSIERVGDPRLRPLR